MNSTDTARRVFLAPNEVPGLMLGALLGESVAFRRILGARRAGRIGLALVASAYLESLALWLSAALLLNPLPRARSDAKTGPIQFILLNSSNI